MHNFLIDLIETSIPVESILGSIVDCVYAFDLEGRYTYANHAVLKILGKTRSEVLGKGFYELGLPVDLAFQLTSQIREVIETRGCVRAQTPFDTETGVGYFEYIFMPILSDGGEVIGVAGTTRDVTHSAQLTAEIKAEREKLKNLFEQSPAFVATLRGPAFIFEFANDEYYKLISRRNIVGKTILEALPEVEDQGFVDLLQKVFETGETYVGRSVQVSLVSESSGTCKKFVDFIYQALKSPSGEVTGILVHGNDVTDQVLARRELDELNRKLEEHVHQRTQELEFANRELEGFTYTIAHDLRAPLRAIVASSQILIRDYGTQLEADARQELDRQAAAAKRLATLIDELLKVARLSRQELKTSNLNLTALAESVAADTLDPNGCTFVADPGLAAVGDETTLRLLLQNLIGNAFKFSPHGGVVQVGQTIAEGKDAFFVRDQGIGFEMKYSHKVFKPFERLVGDSQFEGTGIGLSNVKRIVERHGGSVWCESEVGKGATFFFTLG